MHGPIVIGGDEVVPLLSKIVLFAIRLDIPNAISHRGDVGFIDMTAPVTEQRMLRFHQSSPAQRITRRFFQYIGHVLRTKTMLPHEQMDVIGKDRTSITGKFPFSHDLTKRLGEGLPFRLFPPEKRIFQTLLDFPKKRLQCLFGGLDSPASEMVFRERFQIGGKHRVRHASPRIVG